MGRVAAEMRRQAGQLASDPGQQQLRSDFAQAIHDAMAQAKER
jgi:hypothetical protein